MVLNDVQSAVSVRQKGLYKGVCEAVKKLDLVYKSGKLSKTLFGFEAYSYRLRLKVSLLKLINSDLLLYGSKCEEILWRNVFYEPIYLFKVGSRDLINTPHFAHLEASLKMHLTSALGFYQTLLLKFQADYYRPDVWNKAWNFTDLKVISARSPSHVSVQVSKLAETLCLKFLIYMGDLYRYSLDGDLHARRMAYHYYQLAILINPSNASPHNQLGTLDAGRCYGLNSVYHYLRSVVSEIPFDGAKGNLATVLLRNEARFLSLQEGKSSIPSLQSQVFHRKAAIKLKDLCFTIIKFLYFIHRNAQASLKPEEKNKLGAADQSLMQAILDDVSFVLRSETKRYGAKCVAHMLPDFDQLDDEEELPDFCPDPDLFASQKTASTPLMSPILIRIFLTNLLMIHFLLSNHRPFTVEPTAPAENKEEAVPVSTGLLDRKVLVQSSKLIHFNFYLFDLLLCHSAHALTKTVQMFKTAATRSLSSAPAGGHSRSSAKQTRRRQRQQKQQVKEAEDNDEKENSSADENESKYTENELQATSNAPSEKKTNEAEEAEDNDAFSPDQRLRRRVPRQRRGGAVEDDEDGEEEEEEDYVVEGRRRLGYSNRRAYPGSGKARGSPFLHYSSDGSDYMLHDDGLDDSEEMSQSDDWNSDDSSQLHSQNCDSLSSEDDEEREEGVYHSASNPSSSSGPSHPSRQLDVAGNQIQPTLHSITEEDGCHSSRDKSSMSEGSHESTWAAVAVVETDGDHSNNEEVYEGESEEGDHEEEEREYPTEADDDYIEYDEDKEEVVEEEEEEHEQEKEEEPDERKFIKVGNKRRSTERQRGEKTDVWLRLFVASYFVDSLLAGVKLLSDWLTTSAALPLWMTSSVKESGEKEEDDDDTDDGGPENDNEEHAELADLRQQIAWNLAGLLNFLNPVVLRIESELRSSTLYQICQSAQREFPIVGKSFGTMLSHFSIECRRALHSTFFSASKEEDLAAPPKHSFLPPLPEDWILRGLTLLAPVHESINFDLGNLDVRIEEGVLRCFKLVQFGRRFADFVHSQRNDFHVDFKYHAESGSFTASPPQCVLPKPRRQVRKASRSLANRRRSSHRRWPQWSPSGPRSGLTTSHRSGGAKATPQMMTLIASTKAYSAVHDSSAGDLDGLGLLPDLSSVEKKSEDQEENKLASETKRGEMMRKMAHLRLKDQVETLQRSQKKRGASQVSSSPPPRGPHPWTPTAGCMATTSSLHDISPYLVLDTFCLIGHLPFVKHLLSSQRYVLVIPQAVIAHLDFLKKTVATARSIIRFLEEQVHNGNRNLRIQTADEGSKKPLELSLSRTALSRGEGRTADGAASSGASDDDAAGGSGGAGGDTRALLRTSSRVVYRWLNIFDCALYFSQLWSAQSKSESKAPTVSSWVAPEPKAPIGDQEEEELNAASAGKSSCSSEVVNILKHRIKVMPGQSPRPTITVLLGSRNAPQSDLLVPLQLLKVAHSSGIAVEPILDFAQRWKAQIL